VLSKCIIKRPIKQLFNKTILFDSNTPTPGIMRGGICRRLDAVVGLSIGKKLLQTIYNFNLRALGNYTKLLN
jgi:hypothetical protein